MYVMEGKVKGHWLAGLSHVRLPPGCQRCAWPAWGRWCARCTWCKSPLEGRHFSQTLISEKRGQETCFQLLNHWVWLWDQTVGSTCCDVRQPLLLGAQRESLLQDIEELLGNVVDQRLRFPCWRQAPSIHSRKKVIHIYKSIYIDDTTLCDVDICRYFWFQKYLHHYKHRGSDLIKLFCIC